MTQQAKDEFMGLAYYAADLESSFLAGSPRRERWDRFFMIAKVIGAIVALSLLQVAIGYVIGFVVTGRSPW